MGRMPWHRLPSAIRDRVEAETGAIRSVRDIDGGITADVTAILDTERGRVFCKGIGREHPRAFAHGLEAEANKHLPPKLVPRLRWHVETTAWDLLGFDAVAGHPPDLSIGSEDVPVVLASLDILAELLTPCPPTTLGLMGDRWLGVSRWRGFDSRDSLESWSPWAADHLGELVAWEGKAPELITGDTLVHMDPNPANFLISGGTALLVDWAWPARLAAWCDTGFFVTWLIMAGYPPAAAETQAQRVRAFRDAPDDAVTAFVVRAAGLTHLRVRSNPTTTLVSQRTALMEWARHRIG